MIALVTIVYGLLNVRAHNPWNIADWLINYHAGFIRRGLTGEIALRTGAALHVSPMYLVLLMQLVAYGVIFYVVWQLLAPTRWSPWVLFFVFSPATLAFHVLSPLGGFRKEDLFLAGLGILILSLLRRPRSGIWLGTYLSLFCVGCILSHESLIVYMPYVLAALWIELRSMARVLAISAIPAVLMLFALYAVMLHLGSAPVAQAICASVGQPATLPLSGLCGGSIAYLAHTRAMAHAGILDRIVAYHYYHLYSITGLLALAPLILALRHLWRRKQLHRDLILLVSTMVVSAAASSALFFYADDWGRWIYIHVFSVFLLLLMIDYRVQANPVSADLPPALPSTSGKRVLAAVLFVAYIFAWNMPFLGGYQSPAGYVGLTKYFLGYKSRHQQAMTNTR